MHWASKPESVCKPVPIQAEEDSSVGHFSSDPARPRRSYRSTAVAVLILSSAPAASPSLSWISRNSHRRHIPHWRLLSNPSPAPTPAPSVPTASGAFTVPHSFPVSRRPLLTHWFVAMCWLFRGFLLGVDWGHRVLLMPSRCF